MKLPTYRKHSTRDRAFYEYKRKRHLLPGRYNSPESRKTFDEIIARIERESAPVPDRPELPPKELVTLFDLGQRFLTYAEQRFGTTDRRSKYFDYRRVIRRLTSKVHLNWKTMRASEFGPLRLKEFQAYLIDMGLALNTINSAVGRVRTWFKWCVSEELVEPGVYQALMTVRGLEKGRSAAPDPVPRSPARWNDVERVFEFLNPIHTGMLWLQWYSCARSSSVCMAKPEQFAADGNLLLWRPRHKTEYRGAEVVLPLGPQCQERIATFMDRPTDAYLFNPREGPSGSNPRFNDHYTADSYLQAIVRAQVKVIVKAKKNGAEPPQRWTPHMLRHARGTLVRDAHGVEAAQAVLGHDSLKTTELYSSRRLELAKQIALKEG